MNILNRVKEFFFGKRIKIEDPFFGEMVSTEDTFEGEMYFIHTNKEVRITLEKNGDKITLEQISFYKSIQKDYEQLIDNILPYIEKQLDGWIENYNLRKNFKKDFLLESIFLPACDEKILEWEISYWINNEVQHWCTLKMRNLEVDFIIIDG